MQDNKYVSKLIVLDWKFQQNGTQMRILFYSNIFIILISCSSNFIGHKYVAANENTFFHRSYKFYADSTLTFSSVGDMTNVNFSGRWKMITDDIIEVNASLCGEMDSIAVQESYDPTRENIKLVLKDTDGESVPVPQYKIEGTQTVSGEFNLATDEAIIDGKQMQIENIVISSMFIQGKRYSYQPKNRKSNVFHITICAPSTAFYEIKNARYKVRGNKLIPLNASHKHVYKKQNEDN